MWRFMVRQIKKQPEPSCMADLRREIQRITQESNCEITRKDWAIIDTQQKQSMRDGLHREQFGLCSYCMSRIKPVSFIDPVCQAGMKIEHFESRDNCADRMFDWDNLLGVCGGIYHSPQGTVHHCDDSRGNRPLHVHPASSSPPRPEDIFQYNLNGEKRGMLSSIACNDCGETTCSYCSDLQVLNLNADHLVQNRQAVIKHFRTKLRSLGQNESKICKFLQAQYKLATEPQDNQPLPPYANVAVTYLRSKLRQHGLV